MRVVYLILAHKLPEQLTRLITVLNSSSSHFFIHFDDRAETAFQETKQRLASYSNVDFVTPRSRCRWGQFSIVQATLTSLKTLAASKIDYDYAFLLSGQDYPIKPLCQINSFLEKNRGNQFMDWFPLDQPNQWTEQTGPYQAMRRIQHWHFAYRSRWLHLPIRRELPDNLLPYGGSQWWTLSSDCVQWLTQFIQTNPRVIRFFQNTFIPDELFFQTIVLNSPFKEKVINNTLRYVDFTRANPTPPAVLMKDDFEFLSTGTDALFARKFDSTRDQEILDLIDQAIL